MLDSLNTFRKRGKSKIPKNEDSSELSQTFFIRDHFGWKEIKKREIAIIIIRNSFDDDNRNADDNYCKNDKDSRDNDNNNNCNDDSSRKNHSDDNHSNRYHTSNSDNDNYNDHCYFSLLFLL